MPLSAAERKIIFDRQMGAAPLYSPGAINTPFDLREAAQQTDVFISSIQSSLQNAKRVPVAWLNGWRAFYVNWTKFYATNFSGLLATTGKWLTSDLQSQLVSYQQQAGTWADQAAKYKVTVPGPHPQQDEDSSKTKKTLMYVGVGVIGLVVLGVAAKLLHTVITGHLSGASSDAALAEAEEQALAIVDKKRAKKSAKRILTVS